MRVSALVMVLVSSLAVAACGTGKVGEAVRPSDPTAADALGEAKATCHEVQAEGTPLIVDWPSQSREDLEVAMKKGVAIVHYDCASLRVLADCELAGSYAFVGTTRKEQLITLENSDEAQANLPLGGARLGAAIRRGSTLAIGLVMIGKTTTTVAEVAPARLHGRCDGATHFVRSATLGAFAMRTTAAGEVKAAADLFGIGASGASASAKTGESRDGDLAACRAADPDAIRAPKECRAAVRVQLLALSGGAEPASDRGAHDVACPAGMVAAAGRCVPATTSEPHFCALDAADCAKQCAAGDADSCQAASVVYSLGVDVAKDDAKAAEFDARGCKLHNATSCASSGMDYLDGEGVAADPARGVALLDHACKGGAAPACNTLGAMYLGLGVRAKYVARDVPRALRLYDRACSAGWAATCDELAHLYETGGVYRAGDRGVAVDLDRAKALYKKACEGGTKASCARAR